MDRWKPVLPPDKPLSMPKPVPKPGTGKKKRGPKPKIEEG